MERDGQPREGRGGALVDGGAPDERSRGEHGEHHGGLAALREEDDSRDVS